MSLITYIISAVIGYLLGSINFAVVLCKMIKNEDIRTKGSKNAGANNVTRVYGINMGLLTFIGDFIKASIAAVLVWLIFGAEYMPLASLGCLIGHCWPVYFKFKGGKGVVVGAAGALFIDWRAFLIIIAVFIIMVLLTKRVSVGSLMAALALVPSVLLLNGISTLEIVISIIMFALVWYLHLPNIKRILNGTESKFTSGKQGG